MTGALAAFYEKIPVAHVEAGLRSGNIYAPFPEEMNRRLITQLASYHFAPTSVAVSNLLAEGIGKDSIYCTGNTVIDTLFETKDKIKKNELLPSQSLVHFVEKVHAQNGKLVLLTMHRRESFDEGLKKNPDCSQESSFALPNPAYHLSSASKSCHSKYSQRSLIE